MMVELSLWQLITLLLSFFGFVAGAGKILLSQIDKRLDERFETARADAQNWSTVERQLYKLQADLPLHYVRREDYIRNQTVIEAKLDAVALKIENYHLRKIAE